MEVSTQAIKELRERSEAGIKDCKNALIEAGGDIDRACGILMERGLAKAEKKKSRETREGLIEIYLHPGGRGGAMVELNCETDFVARTEDFKELAHNLAMQVAAMSPSYLNRDEVPESEEAEPEEACLLLQPFIKDPSRTIEDVISETIAKLGENVRVRRFVRFELGE